MAKGIKVGDRIVMRFTVKKVLDDDVALSHPLYRSPITVSANEIPEEDVIRQNGPAKAPPASKDTHYSVVVDSHAVLSTYNRDEAYGLADEIGQSARVDETPMNAKRKR